MPLAEKEYGCGDHVYVRLASISRAQDWPSQLIMREREVELFVNTM